MFLKYLKRIFGVLNCISALLSLDLAVPEEHFLRKVDRAVDFSFIYDLCAPLYCADNGRPAIDPEILFRMLLVGYLYTGLSHRQHERNAV